MRPGDIRIPPGAVDLSGLRRQPPPAQAGPGLNAPDGGAAAAVPPPTPSSGVIVDVTEATFEAEVINRSLHVPVVIDFWAEWCGPCKQLSPVLEKLAVEYAGRWVLAKIDVDAEQRLGQAFQIQSIPSVMAVIGGQPVPLFQGAVGEDQARQVLDEVLRVAAANGVTGTVSVEPEGAADADAESVVPASPPVDPVYEAAQSALDQGDLHGALAAFRSILDAKPNDAEAIASVARCELLLRTQGADEPAVRRAAADAPDDVDAQIAVADLDLLRGAVEDAFARLVDTVRRTSGEDRDKARAHLLSLFAVFDPADPRLAIARRDLTNALF
jgi:putative thioredoxin